LQEPAYRHVMCFPASNLTLSGTLVASRLFSLYVGMFVNRLTGGESQGNSMQTDDEMIVASSDGVEENDDEEDDSPGYAAAAAEKSLSDDDMAEDDFPYEVLTADQLVQNMVECIKDVNIVVQVSMFVSS